MAFFYDIITIGSATRDAVAKSKSFAVVKNKGRGLEESLALPLGSKISIDSLFFGTGGAGTNTAVTFARQQFKTAAIAHIGKDIRGQEVKNELKSEGVDIHLITADPSLLTGYSIILEPPSGERVILRHRGANDGLRGSQIPFSRIRTRWLYLTSLSGDISILKGAFRLKKKYGTCIAWNPGGVDLALGLKKLSPFLSMIDVFIVNQEEAATLLGIPYRNIEKIFKKFDHVIDGIAVMTMGPKGVYVSDGDTLWRAGTYKEKAVVDRTGAGDSFGSGFVAGLMRKKKKKEKRWTDESILYALRMGSANATSKVEHTGAKTGLLAKRQFESEKRWKTLPFSATKIKK
ncbi:MAG: carbohydrate kinase family protein [bacterium]|nr:carbohydrate kinase family protein [bacterium]